MKTKIEKIHTRSKEHSEVRAWVDATFDDQWWYIEVDAEGQFIVCFNGLTRDPGPFHTLAALRWS